MEKQQQIKTSLRIVRLFFEKKKQISTILNDIIFYLLNSVHGFKDNEVLLIVAMCMRIYIFRMLNQLKYSPMKQPHSHLKQQVVCNASGNEYFVFCVANFGVFPYIYSLIFLLQYPTFHSDNGLCPMNKFRMS